ncbi:amidase [Burkholderia ubonensis]|uniref:amidase n=1 Tax=Burkholderia ubonensis TaxID=101571 RepID=UPI0009B34884|nr:amidase [Burkholderia ubonensis]
MRDRYTDATEIAAAVRSGRTLPSAIVESFLATIAAKESTIHAFASFDPTLVRAHAKALWPASLCKPLAGVPIGVKDVIDTSDYPTEFFSPIYRRNQPSRDAHVVSLLKQAGAIVMGKTHTTEFAYMHTGPTRNPLDLDRTPGSSSAGSAAGVAAGFFPLALGTQTAGSLIKPASYCGLFAYKPSFGLVSLEGVKPLAPTFDTVGWLGRSIRDLGLLARVLIPNFDTNTHLQDGLRLAFCRMPGWNQVDKVVADSLGQAINTLSGAGHVMTEISLPQEFAKVYAAHQVINDCEAARSLWKEYQAHPELLSRETLGAIERAKSTTWGAESTAMKDLARLAPIIEDILAPFDAVLTASTGIVAPLGLAKTGSSDFIKFWTAFGFPQINIPFVGDAGSLPIGIQVIARKRCDQLLLGVSEKIHSDLVA